MGDSFLVPLHWVMRWGSGVRKAWGQRRVVKKSCSLTTVDPFFTASWAYSTWSRCPSGEKTVIARSYWDAIGAGLPQYPLWVPHCLSRGVRGVAPAATCYPEVLAHAQDAIGSDHGDSSGVLVAFRWFEAVRASRLCSSAILSAWRVCPNFPTLVLLQEWGY